MGEKARGLKELFLSFTGAALFRGGCGEEAPEGYLRKVLFNISSTIKLVDKPDASGMRLYIYIYIYIFFFFLGKNRDRDFEQI